MSNDQTNKIIKTSEAKRRANDKYDKLHQKSYTVKMQKELYEVLEKAFSENEKFDNQNAWTVQAIKEKLEHDGYVVPDNKK